jgi:hypothetical protein
MSLKTTQEIIMARIDHSSLERRQAYLVTLLADVELYI